MKALSIAEHSEAGPTTPAALMRAFQQFSETSSRLETRYAALLEETEALRKSLREKDIEIERRQRLSVLGQTAAALAHEVRNPLGALSLFLSMLRRDVEDRPQVVALADEMGRCISNLNGVVTNILHFAKDRAIKKTPINLHSIIQDVASHIRAQMPKGGIDVQLNGSPFIGGDEHALRQVFYNLITNSAQAVGYSGRIEISCCSGATDDEVLVRISDDGAGIPPEVIDQIFEPFVSGRAGGTGLGLSIVSQIVDLHSGTIKAWNDDGAVFELKLPRA